MKDIAVGITLGLAVSGLKELMSTNKSFDNLRKLAKQTDTGVRGLSTTLASYRKNLVKINAAQQKSIDAKNQLSKIKNLISNKAVTASFKLAIDFESAMADVSKVVNFANKEEESLFANQIKHLTRDIPLAATDLAAIAAAGGQMGIAKEELLDFTKITAKMSTAFNMSAEEAGDSIGKIMNTYKLGIEEVESLSDAMSHLSDNSASAKEIAEVMQNIGDNANKFGLASEQAAALSFTMLSLGKSPKAAGATINELLSVMATAPEQGAQFQNALAKIGIDAETLKETIEANPQIAITDFLEQLSDVDKMEQMSIFTDLIGEEFADDLAVLVGGIDQYNKAVGSVADKSEYAGSMQKKFEEHSATTANQIQLMKNAINEIGITLGSVFLPELNAVLRVIRSIAYPITDFIENHKTLTKVIGGVVAGYFAFKTILLSGKMVFFWVKAELLEISNTFKRLKIIVLAISTATRKYITTLNLASLRLKVARIATYLYGCAVSFLGTVLGGLAKGLKWAAIGIRLFSVALLTSPIGWFILAVVTAFAGLYCAFEGFRDFVMGIWEGIKSFFSGVAKLFGFGEDNEVEINNKAMVNNEVADVYSDNSYGYESCTPDVYNDSSYDYGGYGAPVMCAQTAGGCNITVNFNGNLAIGSRPDGTFDFNQFKQELIKATKDALKKDTINAENRRIS